MKWKFINKIVVKEEIQLICNQETRKEVMKHELCKAIWGDCEVQWVVQPTINSTGELLCLWFKDYFDLTNSFQGNGFIGLKGIWRKG